MDYLNEVEQLLQQMDANENPSALADALGLLEKLLTNILSYPDEQKYRHIKTSVKALATRLFNIQRMTELLQLLGFIQMDQEFQLPEEHYEVLIDNFNYVKWHYQIAQARLEGPNAVAKAKELIQQQREIKRQIEKEQKEKEKITQQMKYDQQERKLVKAQDAKANQLQFGAKERILEEKEGDVERGESLSTFASHLLIKKMISQPWGCLASSKMIKTCLNFGVF